MWPSLGGGAAAGSAAIGLRGGGEIIKAQFNRLMASNIQISDIHTTRAQYAICLHPLSP